MAYKSKEDFNKYMARYRAKKKNEALEYLGGKCVRCGKINGLEFDHIDPSTKVANITSLLTSKGLYIELDKCQLLCEDCHVEKTSKEQTPNPSGEAAYNAKLSREQVEQIRNLFLTKQYTQTELGKLFSVNRTTIHNIVYGKSWK